MKINLHCYMNLTKDIDKNLVYKYNFIHKSAYKLHMSNNSNTKTYERN